MAEHPNAALARALWLATAQGDADALRALFAPDIRWVNFSAGDLSGEFRGPDGVVGLLARSGELVEDLRSDLIDISTSDRGVVILYRVDAERSGSSHSTELVLVARIEHGLFKDVHVIPAEAEANRRFWASS